LPTHCCGRRWTGRVDKLRKRAIDGIANAKDSDPRQLTGLHRWWLFRGHPYGRSPGDETSLATISPTCRPSAAADGRRPADHRHRRRLRCQGETAQVKQAFGGWAKAAGTLPQVEARPARPVAACCWDAGRDPDLLRDGHVGSKHGDPAEAAQDPVQTAFGGRFTSMLNTELRVKSA
jgi:hypothetical protein